MSFIKWKSSPSPFVSSCAYLLLSSSLAGGRTRPRILRTFQKETHTLISLLNRRPRQDNVHQNKGELSLENWLGIAATFSFTNEWAWLPGLLSYKNYFIEGQLASFVLCRRNNAHTHTPQASPQWWYQQMAAVQFPPHYFPFPCGSSSFPSSSSCTSLTWVHLRRVNSFCEVIY